MLSIFFNILSNVEQFFETPCMRDRFKILLSIAFHTAILHATKQYRGTSSRLKSEISGRKK